MCIRDRPHLAKVCHCLLHRIESALEESIRTICDGEKKDGLSELCQKLERPLAISVMPCDGVVHGGRDDPYLGSPFNSIIRIFNNKKIPHVLENADGNDQNEKGSKIRIVHSEHILGREFESLIYFVQPVNDTFYMNPFTKDLNHATVLRNVSRARNQFHVISPSAKELSLIHI